MTPADYEFLRIFLKQRSGLVLNSEKQYLVESRLMPIAKRAGLASITQLVMKLKDATATQLQEQVVDAMTTNESFFFRDKTPFDHFTQLMLPELLKSRAASKRIRIWCAAASTGQEPYSLAMLLKDAEAKLAGWRFEIIGTDISTEVLDKAKAGVYSQFEVQRGLPINQLLKYFVQNGDVWQINADLRAMVQYRKLNLLESFSTLGQFDIVFCRNVLIYFDNDTKIDVLARIAKQMPDDGYLLLGAAETVVGLTDKFKPAADRRGLYLPAKSGATTPILATGTTGMPMPSAPKFGTTPPGTSSFSTAPRPTPTLGSTLQRAPK